MSKKEREIKFLTRIKKLRLKFFTFLLENKSDLDSRIFFENIEMKEQTTRLLYRDRRFISTRVILLVTVTMGAGN